MMATPAGSDESTLIFYVNGKKIVEKDPDPEETLLKYLRRKLLLTGTKLACGQGACGSCTVMVSHYDHKANKILHAAVVSCLLPVCSLHGMAVTTVEGVGSVNTKLHPIQEQLIKAHGTQCGYCTPGFVMSMYTLLRNNAKPSMEEVQRAIRGNLCRCTGYRPILDGFKPFTKEYCPMGNQCCKRTSSADEDVKLEELSSPCDDTQELIFPSELQLSDALDKQSLTFTLGSVTWIRPTTLKHLLHLKSMYPGSKIVSGNTTLGLERLHLHKHYPVLLCVSHIAEMNDIIVMETGIKFGAAVTLSTVEEYIQRFLADSSKDHKYRALEAFGHMLCEFAALQLKNMVTMGGCVASAWPNSDVTPLLCALGATVDLASSGKPPTSVALDEHFFKGQASTVIADDEVILSVTLPFLKQEQYAYSIKQARCDFDTAIISTAAVLTNNKETNTIKEMKIFLGNILPSVFFARKLSEGLVGKCCETTLTSDALKYLQEDFLTIEKLNREELNANIKTLTEASIWKLIMQVVCDVLGEDAIPADEREAVYPLETGYIESTQVYEEVGEDQSESDAVGRPIVHRSARQQATGEALYVDDTPHYENELYLSLVTSKYGHARILDIDISEAVKVAGVVDVLTHKDIPGKNEFGMLVPDEVVFAVDEVLCYGQIIAAVVATTQDIADQAVRLVNVTYQPLKCITTIQEAIAADSYIGKPTTVQFGDVQLGFEEADQIVEGEVEIGGQEHFYMETVVALVVPQKEDNQLKVFVPVQSGQVLQETIGSVLDIPCSRIGVITKRLGGSFGGKESKYQAALPVALAAYRLKQPVRCVFDRNTDMQITGGRHPTLARYKVGVKKSGIVTALELVVYLNGGCTTDFSPPVLGTLFLNFDNCYHIPNVHLKGRVCKTNLPSNTAMRGFGNPQAICLVETWIQHVAETLGLDPIQVRECNMYQHGDKFPFNVNSETYTSDRSWNELKVKSNYELREKEIQEFNSTSKYRKRGIHIGPLKYPLHFSVAFAYQASALVSIYLDGSVVVHHGGVEMGQGVNTKIIQIASRALEVPIENIHINGTDTEIVPNATISGGSFTSLSNGAAVMDACEKLKTRIKPYKNANPSGSLADWAKAAFFDRVSLSATGFYRQDTPNLGYDWETGKGKAALYYTSGAACAEVEVDIITGQHVVRRVDIVMDVGKSLNPAIDIGQIEGGFLQGYGLYTLEELKFDKNGRLTTINAMGYKIPQVTNVPRQFNVTLLKESSNPYAVYSAKGIGEPPLLLAINVPLAIREAMKAYRRDINQNDYFTLKYPVTPDQVRAHCPK